MGYPTFVFQFLTDGIRFLLRGGPLMWPLFACAVISIAVMIERTISIRRAARDTDSLLRSVGESLRAGRVGDAQALAERTTGPVAQLIALGLRSRHLDADAIERQMEELALRETPTLMARLWVLDTIITLSPLLGLLGTVTGMIKAFHVIGLTGLNGPTAITGGVAEALIATATGLAIAIVTLVGYNYLSENVKLIIADMEVRATQLLNMLAAIRPPERQPALEDPPAGD
jgi:biopolymer transport protein ExbB